MSRLKSGRASGVFVLWRRAGRKAKWHVPKAAVPYATAVTEADELLRAGHGVMLVSETFPELVEEYRANPGEVLVFGPNPAGGTRGARKLGKAHQLKYQHATAGPRVHDFDGHEVIELLRDGSIRVYDPNGNRLWEMF